MLYTLKLFEKFCIMKLLIETESQPINMSFDTNNSIINFLIIKIKILHKDKYNNGKYNIKNRIRL